MTTPEHAPETSEGSEGSTPAPRHTFVVSLATWEQMEAGLARAPRVNEKLAAALAASGILTPAAPTEAQVRGMADLDTLARAHRAKDPRA